MDDHRRQGRIGSLATILLLLTTTLHALDQPMTSPETDDTTRPDYDALWDYGDPAGTR